MESEQIQSNFSRNIGKKMSLIDLNKDLINFNCEFSITSKEPFQAVVVTQEQLDNPEFKIEYQTVENGMLNGTFKNENNVYFNYCLLLKSEKDITVNINIKITPLPLINTEPENKENKEDYSLLHKEHTKKLNVPFYKTSTFTWIIIFVGIGLIIYLLFSESKKNNSTAPVVTSSVTSTTLKSPPSIVKSPPFIKSPSVVKSPPVVKSSPVVKSPPSLLSKLKNTNI